MVCRVRFENEREWNAMQNDRRIEAVWEATGIAEIIKAPVRRTYYLLEAGILPARICQSAERVMTSRLLLSGMLASPAVRRRRRADGAVFTIARIRDTDRGASRDWRLFANDPALIERLEEMRVGEPTAVSGPFSVVI